MAIRLIWLSLLSAATVCVYTLALPALKAFEWSFTVGQWTIRLDEYTLLEAVLWLALYGGYAVRYRSMARLIGIGRRSWHKVLPMFLAFLPTILFFVPLRVLVINYIGPINSSEALSVVLGWMDTPLRLAILIATCVAVLLFVTLIFLAMRVLTTRAMMNKQLLGKAYFWRAVRDGVRHCLAPAAVCLRHAFWLVSMALVMVASTYLLTAWLDWPLTYLALMALVAIGYWAVGLGPGFWGRYQVTFICLLRRLSDGSYADTKRV